MDNLKIEDNDLEMIMKNLACFSINNTIYSCLYSGFGVEEVLSEKNILKIKKELISEQDYEDTIKNYIPLYCIYSKSIPSIDNSFIYPKYKWKFENFDKTITIEAQALSILALCTASQYLPNKAESLFSIRTAINIYDFVSSFLRNDTGEFIDAYNKSEKNDQSLKLKLDKHSTSLYAHILMFEASITLESSLFSTDFKLINSKKLIALKEDYIQLWDYILDNSSLLIIQKSDELVLGILSLLRILTLCEDTNFKTSINNLVLILSLELSSRVNIAGEIQKSIDSNKAANTITHIRAVTAFNQLSSIIGVEYLALPTKLIDGWLGDLYDEQSLLILDCLNETINYSINEIIDILGYYLITKKDYSSFKQFYKTVFENTSFMKSISIIQSHKDANDINIPNGTNFIASNNKAPVFFKSIKISPKKFSPPVFSKHYSSSQSLYAAYLILHFTKFSNFELFSSNKID